MMDMANHHRIGILISADALILAFYPELLDAARDITVTKR